jgi:hypothetical protein
VALQQDTSHNDALLTIESVIMQKHAQASGRKCSNLSGVFDQKLRAIFTTERVSGSDQIVRLFRPSLSWLACFGSNMRAVAQFSQTNTCGTSVAVGTNCTINVVYKPTVNRSLTATLKVNAGGAAP